MDPDEQTYNQYLQEIGHCFHHFSQMEKTLEAVLRHWKNNIPGDFLSKADRVAIICEALIAANHPASDLIEKCQVLNKKRNELAHGTWAGEPSGPLELRIYSKNRKLKDRFRDDEGAVWKYKDIEELERLAAAILHVNNQMYFWLESTIQVKAHNP